MFSVLFVIVDQIINKSSTYLFSENNFNRLVLTATNLLNRLKIKQRSSLFPEPGLQKHISLQWKKTVKEITSNAGWGTWN